jgi:hypothetical protein
MARLLALLTLAILLLGAGCAADSDVATATFEIQPGSYLRVFDAARDTLADRHFPIERVDTSAGVLTTGARPTAGLATPWDTDQTTLAQEFEDFLNTTSRSVRITFEPLAQRLAPDPAPRAAAASPEPMSDLRRAAGPIVVEVRVTLERTRRPGWRPDPSGVWLSTTTVDLRDARRRMVPAFTEPVGQDGLLARRIARQIRRRAGLEEPTRAEDPPPPAPGDA